MSSNKNIILADLSLLGIAVIWGYTFVLTKDLLEEMTPFYFTGTRFLLAALLIFLFKWKDVRNMSWQVWKMGLTCGLALWAGFTTQTLGIELTTPGKAGVITGMTVIIVPFLYFVWSRVPLQIGPLVGSILAFGGLCLMSWDGDWVAISFGDFLVFLCAVSFAIHFIMIDRVYERGIVFEALTFVMIQLFVVGAINVFIAVWTEPLPQPLSPYGWYAYLFDFLIGTMLAYIVQMKAQKFSPPTHVSLLLGLESVFSFVFSWALWGEVITSTVITGVSLILLGILVTEIFDLLRTSKSSTIAKQ